MIKQWENLYFYSVTMWNIYFHLGVEQSSQAVNNGETYTKVATQEEL